MKNTIVTVLLLTLFLTSFSQKISYSIRELHGLSSRTITKEKLISANNMGDLAPGYPSSWVGNYVSVDIMASCFGKVQQGMGRTETLTPEQKTILNGADLNTDVVVEVKYKSTNAANGQTDVRVMNFSLTVIPEIQAEYPGGQQHMAHYLEEKAINSISTDDSPQFKGAIIQFSVNENGEIIQSKIKLASGDPEIDEMLLRTINNMPKWKPAENAQGLKVKQDFEFTVDAGMGGC